MPRRLEEVLPDDYEQFWNLVEGRPEALEDRYARDGGLPPPIAEASA